jgi:hypothetical protein
VDRGRPVTITITGSVTVGDVVYPVSVDVTLPDALLDQLQVATNSSGE